ncbi:MAG: purine-binding chemotaxis protein CheW [Deltaproteobacteria bacterium]|nr:purine-binding chemotaxis protein CheW [Deltaproteobacteria bacterium]
MNKRDRITKAAPEVEKVVQMISFTVGTERFGVEILDVQEIIMMSEITEIPNSPEFVEGVINLRGNIIPVLDLRKRLRLRGYRDFRQYAPTTRILVVEIEGNITGFIVDSVAKVISVPLTRITPPPDIIVAGVQSQYISGVVHLDEGILVILDFRRILSVEEKHALDTVPRMVPAVLEGASR